MEDQWYFLAFITNFLFIGADIVFSPAILFVAFLKSYIQIAAMVVHWRFS